MTITGLARYLVQDGILTAKEYYEISKQIGYDALAFTKGILGLNFISEDKLVKYIAAKNKNPNLSKR